MKKIISLTILLIMFLAVFAGCTQIDPVNNNSDTVDDISDTSADMGNTVDTVIVSEYFSDADFKDVTGETCDAEIELNGSTGVISDTARGSSGSNVTITSKGIYRITGTSEGVTVTVNDSKKSGNVYLILDNVNMTNNGCCINVENADKVIIQLVGESSLTNTLEDKGTIYSKDDITVNGSGTLTLSSAKHGIVCKNDLKITDGTLLINAEYAGLKADDSVRISGGNITIISKHDGIQVDSDEGSGYFIIEDGTLTIDAVYDGIDVGTSVASEYTGFISVNGNSIINITSGGGSDNSVGDNSSKGLKCDGSISVSSGNVIVSSSDDGLHAEGDINISGGNIFISTSDDAVNSGTVLTVSGGIIDISKCYEGLDSEIITITSGEISVVSSDDGVSAGDGGFYISGGSLVIDSKGDGIDSNGNIEVSGGNVVIEGPSNSGNAALDYGDGFEFKITGGTVLALGTIEKAVNFSSGTQCSALVKVSGENGTIIKIDDGSGFEYTAEKPFTCVLYSSSSLEEGKTYILTSGSTETLLDFTSGRYYSNID